MKKNPKSYPHAISGLRFIDGVGDGKTTACVVSAAAIIDALCRGVSLDGPTDELDCCCPILRRLAIFANDTDWWDSEGERTEVLSPLIPLLLDSRVSPEQQLRRMYHIANRTIKTLTPHRLERLGRILKPNAPSLFKKINESIQLLKDLPDVVDAVTNREARGVLAKIQDAHNAYADDADDAAYESVYDAEAFAYAAAAYDTAEAEIAEADSAYEDADDAASEAAYAYAAAATANDDQKTRYRSMFIQLFREVAEIK